MNPDKINLIADFIFESDAIENIQDNWLKLQGEIRANKKTGHVGAILLLNSLASQMINQLLSHDLICRVQGLITAEQHQKPGGTKLPKKYVGHYRDVDVMVGGRLCTSPGLIKREMDALLERVIWFQQNSRFQSWDSILRTIADFHFDFERVHPFFDGNGRTGRALALFFFRYCGFDPFVFTSEDKRETYYSCFLNKEKMRKYFLERLIK